MDELRQSILTNEQKLTIEQKASSFINSRMSEYMDKVVTQQVETYIEKMIEEKINNLEPSREEKQVKVHKVFEPEIKLNNDTEYIKELEGRITDHVLSRNIEANCSELPVMLHGLSRHYKKEGRDLDQVLDVISPETKSDTISTKSGLKMPLHEYLYKANEVFGEHFKKKANYNYIHGSFEEVHNKYMDLVFSKKEELGLKLENKNTEEMNLIVSKKGFISEPFQNDELAMKALEDRLRDSGIKKNDLNLSQSIIELLRKNNDYGPAKEYIETHLKEVKEYYVEYSNDKVIKYPQYLEMIFNATEEHLFEDRDIPVINEKVFERLEELDQVNRRKRNQEIEQNAKTYSIEQYEELIGSLKEQLSAKESEIENLRKNIREDNGYKKNGASGGGGGPAGISARKTSFFTRLSNKLKNKQKIETIPSSKKIFHIDFKQRLSEKRWDLDRTTWGESLFLDSDLSRVYPDKDAYKNVVRECLDGSYTDMQALYNIAREVGINSCSEMMDKWFPENKNVYIAYNGENINLNEFYEKRHNFEQSLRSEGRGRSEIDRIVQDMTIEELIRENKK